MAMGPQSLKMPWRPCTPQGSAKCFSWHKYTILRGLRSTPPKFGRDSALRPNFSGAPNPCFAGGFASSRGNLPCEFGLTTKPMRNCSRLREAGAVLRRRHSASADGEQKMKHKDSAAKMAAFPVRRGSCQQPSATRQKKAEAKKRKSPCTPFRISQDERMSESPVETLEKALGLHFISKMGLTCL